MKFLSLFVSAALFCAPVLLAAEYNPFPAEPSVTYKDLLVAYPLRVKDVVNGGIVASPIYFGGSQSAVRLLVHAEGAASALSTSYQLLGSLDAAQVLFVDNLRPGLDGGTGQYRTIEYLWRPYPAKTLKPGDPPADVSVDILSSYEHKVVAHVTAKVTQVLEQSGGNVGWQNVVSDVVITAKP